MAACSCKAIGETCHYTCLCIKFWNYNHLGYLKGANEVKRQYFQQAVLLCWLKALYYAGIYMLFCFTQHIMPKIMPV